VAGHGEEFIRAPIGFPRLSVHRGILRNGDVPASERLGQVYLRYHVLAKQKVVSAAVCCEHDPLQFGRAMAHCPGRRPGPRLTKIGGAAPARKKADVEGHPWVFLHVGLLVDEPPGPAGLPFIQSSDDIRSDFESRPPVCAGLIRHCDFAPCQPKKQVKYFLLFLCCSSTDPRTGAPNPTVDSPARAPRNRPHSGSRTIAAAINLGCPAEAPPKESGEGLVLDSTAIIIHARQ
jgi:hypothetical protein